MQIANVNNNNNNTPQSYPGSLYPAVETPFMSMPGTIPSPRPDPDFQLYLAQLDSLGFTNRNKNLKLLKKTNGNFSVVQQFLIAHEQFRRAVKENKTGAREEKFKRKLEKIREKRAAKAAKKVESEGSSSSSSSSDSSSDDDDDKKDKKSIKKMLKEERKKFKKEHKLCKKHSKDSYVKGVDVKQEEKEMSKEDKKALKKVFKDEVKRMKLEFKLNKLDRSRRGSYDHKDWKTEKKALKKIYKEQKKCAKHDKTPLPTELPEGTAAVYLDGNNMLYVAKAIRDRCIKRGNGVSADRVLEGIARAWANQLKAVQVVLIFDNVNYGSEESGFRVCSAKPHFYTSDDALIYWSQQMHPEQAKHAVMFTSDQQLTTELLKTGVQVLKSKGWFEIAAKALGRYSGESIDQWTDRWIAENLDICSQI